MLVDDGDVTLQNESLEPTDSVEDSYKLFLQLKNKAPSMASLTKSSFTKQNTNRIDGNSNRQEQGQSARKCDLPTPPEQLWSSPTTQIHDVKEMHSESTDRASAKNIGDVRTSTTNSAKAGVKKTRKGKSSSQPAYSIVIGDNSPTVLVFGDCNAAITISPSASIPLTATSTIRGCVAYGRGGCK